MSIVIEKPLLDNMKLFHPISFFNNSRRQVPQFMVFTRDFSEAELNPTMVPLTLLQPPSRNPPDSIAKSILRNNPPGVL